MHQDSWRHKGLRLPDLDVTGNRPPVRIASRAREITRSAGAEAKFEVTGEKPQAINAPVEEAVILTPKPPLKPRINGAKVFGVRPGSPFLFTIPATDDRPMEFSAKGLPKGLKLDAKTGRITGSSDNYNGSILNRIQDIKCCAVSK